MVIMKSEVDLGDHLASGPSCDDLVSMRRPVVLRADVLYATERVGRQWPSPVYSDVHSCGIGRGTSTRSYSLFVLSWLCLREAYRSRVGEGRGRARENPG